MQVSQRFREGLCVLYIQDLVFVVLWVDTAISSELLRFAQNHAAHCSQPQGRRKTLALRPDHFRRSGDRCASGFGESVAWEPAVVDNEVRWFETPPWLQ